MATPMPPPVCTHTDDLEVSAEMVWQTVDKCWGLRLRVVCRDCGMPFKFEDKGWRYDENRMLCWIVKPQGQ